MAGLWCTALGFGNARLVQAAARSAKLPYYHSFAHNARRSPIELAEAAVKLAPVPMSKAFFSNSGSEANDTAVKLVWYYNNAIGRRRRRRSSPASAPITASPSPPPA